MYEKKMLRFARYKDMKFLLISDPEIDIKLDYIYNLETNTFSQGA